jgi:hypothetical protein
MVSFGPNVTSKSVTVPIVNNGVFGASDVDITLKLTSPGSGATLGAVSSGTLVIHDNNPPKPPPPPPPPLPPLVTVKNVYLAKLNKKHQVTEVFVVFSGPVNSTEADQTSGIYRLATAGKKGSYTAKNAGIIHLKSATYTETGGVDSVALIPKKPFALTKTVQLLVSGLAPSGLQDSDGRYIDGDGNGTAGGNAIAYITKKGETLNGVLLARAAAGTPTRATEAIDALLARGELAGLRKLIRIEH